MIESKIEDCLPVNLVDVRCVANWYIDKTVNISEAYHGLGSLNVFLYILSGLSVQHFGYQFFNDKISVLSTGPAFDKLVAYYSDQASFLSKKVSLECSNFEFTVEQTKLMEESYAFVNKYKPQRIRDWIIEEDSPWYLHYKSETNVGRILSEAEICESVKKILIFKAK